MRKHRFFPAAALAAILPFTASPALSAIQPAWRPITSTTMHRLCDSAVVRSRSIDSVAIETAVSKPKV